MSPDEEIEKALDAMQKVADKDTQVPFQHRRAARHEQALAQLWVRTCIGSGSCSHFSNRRKGYMNDDWPITIAG